MGGRQFVLRQYLGARVILASPQSCIVMGFSYHVTNLYCDGSLRDVWATF
jgi:hypothetical protein